MVLRNLQMLPFVNCPNGTALFLGTYDSKLSLLKPLRSYVTHSNKVFPTISHLVRYDSSKFPLAGQESPFHGKGVVPPVPWPFTPETRALARSYISALKVPPSVLSFGCRQKQNQETYYLLVPNRNAVKLAAASRGHPGLAL